MLQAVQAENNLVGVNSRQHRGSCKPQPRGVADRRASPSALARQHERQMDKSMCSRRS